MGVAAIVVTALYVARDILVPLALAILLSFALGPLVMRLRRLRCGRVPSVAVAVLLAVLVIAAVGTLIGSQFTELADELPQYETNVADKIHSVRTFTTSSFMVRRGASMLRKLGADIAGPVAAPTQLAAPTPAPAPLAPAATRAGTIPLPPVASPPIPAPPAGGAAPSPRPVVVEVHARSATPFDIVQKVMGPLLRPLATAGIVVVFVVFFLLQREDLRDRFIRLAGLLGPERYNPGADYGSASSQPLSLDAVRDQCLFRAADRPRDYGSSACRNPALWGVLAMLLRFVPYIGPVIAATFPLAVSFAVDPGWSMLFWTVRLVSDNRASRRSGH